MPTRRNFRTIALLLGLVLTLAGVAFGAYQGADHTGPFPADMTLAMTLGIVFSFAVDIGLVALLFYSSRKRSLDPPPQRD